MIVRRRRFTLFLILTLLWMALIFWKSGEPYQQQDLKPLLHTFVSEQTLARLIPPVEFTYDGGLVSYRNPFHFVEFFIRKGGHVTEFFILAALMWGMWTATALRRPTAWGITFVLSVLYAASDEWHQTFVPHRTGHSIDVWVDACGVLLALLIVPYIKKLSR